MVVVGAAVQEIYIRGLVYFIIFLVLFPCEDNRGCRERVKKRFKQMFFVPLTIEISFNVTATAVIVIATFIVTTATVTVTVTVIVTVTVTVTLTVTVTATKVTVTTVTVTIDGVINDANATDFRFRFSLSALFIP